MNTDKNIARLRDTLLNEMLLGLALVSVPMVALSLSRIPMMGWRPVFGIQIIFVSILCLLWWLRRHISYSWRLGMVLFLVGGSGLAGYAQHGPATSSGQLVLLVMIITVLFTKGKAAASVGLAIFAGLLLIAWSGISGVLTFRIDYEAYAHNPITWALIILAFVGYGGTTAFLVWRLLHSLIGNERQLAKVNTELAVRSTEALAATQAKSQFMATMSHEIRTPMNGILGMAQLLLMQNLTENERRVYAETIFSSGQTLLALLNDILDLSKIEAGKFQLDSVFFEPDAILSETQMLFSGAAHTKGLQLETKWNGLPSSRYVSDATRIRQMLLNLVGNAIKFTKGGCVRIEGSLIEHEGESALLEFSVSDTGIGIAPDKIDLLFKPFSQTDTSIMREFGGSGLGLSIVRHLAKMMGGDVGVESVVGKGSRFWFRLRAKNVADGEECRCSERPSNAEPALLSGRVLVVEDNDVNRMVIESMLTKLGVSVTLAHDGQQALDTLTQGDCPYLVLMDLNMPVMDGYGATERIRQWEQGNNRPRLPVIALTADAYEDDRQHCLAVGMDDFLTKPIMLDAMQSALRKWLSVPNSNSESHLT